MIEVDPSRLQKLVMRLFGPFLVRAYPFEEMFFLEHARKVREAVRRAVGECEGRLMVGSSTELNNEVPLANYLALRAAVLDSGSHGRVGSCCGVEQWQLVGLITQRSAVRIRPPRPHRHRTCRTREGVRPFVRYVMVPWWLERGGTTRSHPEHGSETSQRRRYCTRKGVGQ